MLPTIPLTRIATQDAAKSYAWFGLSVSVCSFLTLSADRKLFGWTEELEKMVLKMCHHTSLFLNPIKPYDGSKNW
jgi:hypothetical protein